MEHSHSQPTEFDADQPLAARVLTCLRCEDGISRMQALRTLKNQAPREVLDVIVALLNHAEEEIRRRAGGALTFYSPLHGETVNVQQKAEELANYLREGEDPRVRLSCCIALMSVKGLSVDRAYLHALRDPEQKVAQIACLEVGDRGSSEGTAALFKMLEHPNWRVRLEVCKALMVQKTADQRVVSSLEAMSREGEAAVYDAEDEDSAELSKLILEACMGGDTDAKCWGKLDTIITDCRRLASKADAGTDEP